MIKKELIRKMLHLALTTYPLFLYKAEKFFLIQISVTILLLVLWYISEVLRFYYKIATPTYFLIKHMLRSNRDIYSLKILAPNWLIGYLVSVLIFPSVHFINGVCVLSFGDAAAAIFGVKGKRKSIRGSLAGIVISFLMCIFFTQNAWTAIGASIFGMGIEYCSGKNIDNYFIPFFGSLGSFIFSSI